MRTTKICMREEPSTCEHNSLAAAHSLAANLIGGDMLRSDDEEEWDDDMSWKVRRASSKLLSAIAATRPELLSNLYTKVVPVLINRCVRHMCDAAGAWHGIAVWNIKNWLAIRYSLREKQVKSSLVKAI